MKKHFYTLLFCVFGFVLKSQATEIFDIATNKKYESIQYSKEYTSKKSYFNKTIEIEYQYINAENDTKITKINNQTFDICKNYIENEIAYLSIIREGNLRIETFNTIENSKRNYRDGKLQNPELKSISLKIVSIINNHIFYEIKLIFEAKNTNDNYDNNQEIEVSEYYLSNINSGLISKWKPIIKENIKKKIEDLVYKNFQQTYLTLTNKLTAKEILEYDFIPKTQNKDLKASNFTSVFNKIDVSKADFYWYNSGLIIQFQEFSNGRVLYGGKFFNLFFPYDEAMEIIKNIPEFSFVYNLPAISTSIKNWSSFDPFYKKTMEISTEPQMINFISNVVSSKKVKSLTQTNYQLNGTPKRRFQGKIVTEFNVNQKPLSVLSYGENEKISGSTFNDYDQNDNLVFVTKKSDYDKPSHSFYLYDSNFNLKKVTTFEKDECYISSYFYNKNYLYTTSTSFFKQADSNYFTKYEINSNLYKIAETEYIINENNQLKSIISDKNFQSQIQIGRDEKGRIKETHKENDRYNYYFEYDEIGRLSNYMVYEYTEEKEKITFLYNQSELFPYKKTKTTNYGGNTIFLEENYEWTYFE